MENKFNKIIGYPPGIKAKLLKICKEPLLKKPDWCIKCKKDTCFECKHFKRELKSANEEQEF